MVQLSARIFSSNEDAVLIQSIYPETRIKLQSRSIISPEYNEPVYIAAYSNTLGFLQSSNLLMSMNEHTIYNYKNTSITGNLGIGTDIPLQSLHVQNIGYFSSNLGIGTINPRTRLEIQTVSGNTGDLLCLASAQLPDLYNLKIKATNPEPFVVNYAFQTTNSGSIYNNTLVLEENKVGINTNSPTQSLHIEGDAYLHGNLNTTGTISASNFILLKNTITTNTVATLNDAIANVQNNNIKVNEYIQTLGRYTIGDTGDNYYLVASNITLTPDNGSVISCGNEKYLLGKFIQNYVTYVQFGADLTGTNLSGDAIANAHIYANSNNLPVKQSKGTFRLGNSNIIIQTDVDWTGSTIVVDNTSSNAPYAAGYIRVQPTSGYDKQTYTNGVASTPFMQTLRNQLLAYKSKLVPNPVMDSVDIRDLTCLSNIKDTMIAFESTNLIETTRTNNTNYYLKDTCLISKGGQLVAPLLYDFSQTSDFDSILFIPKQPKYLTLQGLNIVASNVGSVSVLRIERPQTILRNTTYREITDTPLNSIRTIVTVNNCWDIVIEDFNSEAIPYGSGSGGTYTFNINTAINVRLHRMRANAGWGCMATEQTKIFYVSDCDINRIDSHVMMYDLRVDNCRLKDLGINLMGGGSLKVTNCEYYIDTVPANYTYSTGNDTREQVANAFIQLRGDYSVGWRGSIILENLKCRISSLTKFSINPFILVETIRNNNQTFNYNTSTYGANGITMRNVLLELPNVSYQLQVIGVAAGGYNNYTNVYVPNNIHIENVRFVSASSNYIFQAVKCTDLSSTYTLASSKRSSSPYTTDPILFSADVLHYRRFNMKIVVRDCDSIHSDTAISSKTPFINIYNSTNDTIQTFMDNLDKCIPNILIENIDRVHVVNSTFANTKFINCGINWVNTQSTSLSQYSGYTFEDCTIIPNVGNLADSSFPLPNQSYLKGCTLWPRSYATGTLMTFPSGISGNGNTIQSSNIGNEPSAGWNVSSIPLGFLAPNSSYYTLVLPSTLLWTTTPQNGTQSATYNINIVEDGFLKGLLTGTSRPYPPTGYYPSYDSTDLNSNVILYLADAGTNNYGLGQYTTNSSSYQDGFDTRYILDNSSTSVWQSGAFTYELYTGIPSSTAAQTSYYPTTSSTTLNTISGEYVTLQLPVSVSPTTFSIQANTFNLLNSPSQVLILGSTDGLTWILLTDPGLLDFTTSTNAILNISVPSQFIGIFYNYYRIVVKNVLIGATYTEISTVTVYGYEDSTFSTSNIYPVPLVLDSIYASQAPNLLYPPATPTYTTNSTVTLSGAIYGNGVYTTNQSSLFSVGNGNYAYKLLIPTDNAALNYVSAASVGTIYDSNTGVYLGTRTTTLIDSTLLPGEWFEISPPLPIKFTGFQIRQIDGYYGSRPNIISVVVKNTADTNYTLLQQYSCSNLYDSSGIFTGIISSNLNYYNTIRFSVSNIIPDVVNPRQGTMGLYYCKLYGIESVYPISTIYPPTPPTLIGTGISPSMGGNNLWILSSNNEIYTIDQSSYNAVTQTASNILGNPSINSWRVATGKYTNSLPTEPATSTTCYNGTVIKGEFADVTYPYYISPTSITVTREFTSSSNVISVLARNSLYTFSSNNWYQIATIPLNVSGQGNTPQTVSTTSDIYGLYYNTFRYVITQSFTTTMLKKVSITGYRPTDSSGTISYNSLYKYPAANLTTITTSNISEINGVRNGNNTFIISGSNFVVDQSSSRIYDGTVFGWKVFDGILTTRWQSAQNYRISDGLYSPVNINDIYNGAKYTNYNSISSQLYGEYFQIRMSLNIVPTTISIISSTSLTSSVITIAGQTYPRDNTVWLILNTVSNPYQDGNGKVDIPISWSKYSQTYNSFRVIFQKINSGNTYISINTTGIYGYVK